MDDLSAIVATVDGERFSDWYDRRKISRSTAFELLKILHVTPDQRRIPGSARPVLFLTGEQVDVLDVAADQLQGGKTLSWLRAASETAIVAPAGTVPDHPGEASGIIQDLPLLDRLTAISTAMATGAPLTTAEVRQLLGVIPGAAVVRRGRVVARRHGRNVWSLDSPGSSREAVPDGPG